MSHFTVVLRRSRFFIQNFISFISSLLHESHTIGSSGRNIKQVTNANHICNFKLFSLYIKKSKRNMWNLYILFDLLCPSEIFYLLKKTIEALKFDVFYTYSPYQVRPTTFQVLTSHMWLVAAILNSMGRNSIYRKSGIVCSMYVTLSRKLNTRPGQNYFLTMS